MNKTIKGLNLLTIGLVFAIINLNITIGNTVVNFTPDWIGYVIMYFAVINLCDNNAKYKWLPYLLLALSLCSIALWILEILKVNIDTYIIEMIWIAMQDLAIFFVLSLLSEKAGEIRSPYAKRFVLVRNIILVSMILTLIGTFLTQYNEKISVVLVLIFGTVVLISVIVAIVMIFLFKKEYAQCLENQENSTSAV